MPAVTMYPSSAADLKALAELIGAALLKPKWEELAELLTIAECMEMTDTTLTMSLYMHIDVLEVQLMHMGGLDF